MGARGARRGRGGGRPGGLIITPPCRVRGRLRDPAALGTSPSPAAGEEASEAEALSFSPLFFVSPPYRER